MVAQSWKAYTILFKISFAVDLNELWHVCVSSSEYFFLTFTGFELKACLVLLHQGLVDSGVVCGRHLAVEGDATRWAAFVLQSDAEHGILAHTWSVTLHGDITDYILSAGQWVHASLAAMTKGRFHSMALLLWTWRMLKVEVKLQLFRVKESLSDVYDFSPSGCLYWCVISTRLSEPTALVLMQWPTAFLSTWITANVPQAVRCQKTTSLFT